MSILSSFATKLPTDSALPLSGVRVIDFTTLLPGPLATLILAEAGAEILKIERPDHGDEMRRRSPRFGRDSATFALLNRGKRSLAIDLKEPKVLQKLYSLLTTADVLVEQFRPGVMQRLGLSYEAAREINPAIVYCSVTGYGQSGDDVEMSGHDLNYMAEAGLLSVVCDKDGTPTLPPALIADIAGGAYPAVMNILLALLRKEKTGEGCRLDITMTRNLLPFLYRAIARGTASGIWPSPGADEVTGGSPRYQIYRTRDSRFIAVAALEDKFWKNFCEIIDLPETLCVPHCSPGLVCEAVAKQMASRTALEWERTFAGRDVCCSVVRTIAEAIERADLLRRDAISRYVTTAATRIPALPIPLDHNLRNRVSELGYPYLGEANRAFLDSDADASDTRV